MFIEFFNWFCNNLFSIFELMKKFVLFEGFTYYNFCVALLAIPIIIKLFHFIMGIEDEEAYFTEYTSEYESPYDDYEPKHASHKKSLFISKLYRPKHASKDRS